MGCFRYRVVVGVDVMCWLVWSCLMIGFGCCVVLSFLVGIVVGRMWLFDLILG